MQPQDLFDRHYDALVAALGNWADSMRDAAEVSTERSNSFWRLKMEPSVRGACPVEIILYKAQTYDVMIATEAYEALPLDESISIQPMLEAIVAGEVRTRTTRSAATDRPLAVATSVGLAFNPIWEQMRVFDPSTADAGQIVSEKHYPPYQRR